MCTYQTLYWNQDNGYVFRCAECRNMQIAFGSMLLTFEESVYPDFCRLIRTISEECGEIGNLALKQIRVPLPYDGIFLLLSKRELENLMEMLDRADSEWRSLSMLQLFTAERNGD
jgi:hypothetical protein